MEKRYMSATLELDSRKTALLLIDLQNGIIERDTKPYTAWARTSTQRVAHLFQESR
jgi:nicotinamidase-related amidase